ncbi:hypothetical protein [Maricaulis maris]|uniref:hypothetical protein n=1 Tax=Maricaulis maris TaxID=74318 RepID=UPI003B8DB7EC
MVERLKVRDFVQAGLLCLALCFALLAIRFEVFGWIGSGATILIMVGLLCAGQARLRWRLILPAILLGSLGYSAASATMVAAFL